ncbi:hypothetical protein F442_05320 [Phytophthora nicotianae P10297]|uniref:Uncharacterized protein n=2 Tax=Phytophthora nicotianae TaxID=4792 RepID=W2ZP41_PHYNI|nr:hypothetical protein L914_05087 [Phytophthora nicotianae]ETP49073.1 hypothetical protein F442_05320 [Phytophthora nicotianae P10297]
MASSEALANANQSDQRQLRTHHAHHPTEIDSEERGTPTEKMRKLACLVGMDVNQIDDLVYKKNLFKVCQETQSYAESSKVPLSPEDYCVIVDWLEVKDTDEK